MILRRMLLGALTAIAFSVSAQSPIDALPVKMVNGLSYHYYKVESKETIYSICRKLDISRDELVRTNPSVEDGLKAGQMLYFPVEVSNVTSRIHLVKKKETLYGIGKKYGVTPEQLCDWNPEAKDGLKAGQRLIVSPPLNLKPVAAQTAVPVDDIPMVELPQGQTHVITVGETLYSISKAYSTTVDAIVAANPGLDRAYYQAGTSIVIPVTASDNLVANAPQQIGTQPEVTLPAAVNQQDSTGFTLGHPLFDEPLYAASDTFAMPRYGAMTIAIALPFGLSSEEQSKQAQLYTEFYKGFLLAVDEMRDCGTPINILTYDSSHPTGVSGILNDPKIRYANLIIAPDVPAQLSAFCDFGRLNNIKVLNLFAVKDDNYETNPILLQGNIPPQVMYDKAIDGLLSRIENRIPIILTRNNGEVDKDDYVDRLRTRLIDAGIQFQDITFNDILRVGAFDDLEPDSQYVFIPASGKQAELNRVLPVIIDFKSKSTAIDPVMVFGYPEWITFRGETLTNMHKANTVVYSRFFTEADNPAISKLEQQFESWYGAPMANFMPRQGLFGYDSGMFVINWLKSGSYEPISWEGVQNGFEFSRIPGGGEVNNTLYFISYKNNGDIVKSEK